MSRPRWRRCWRRAASPSPARTAAPPRWRRRTMPAIASPSADLTAPGRLRPRHLTGAAICSFSIPPDGQGDPVLRHHRDVLAARAGQLDWVGYLSTTGVYGDRAGNWVDETAPLAGDGARAAPGGGGGGMARLQESAGLPIHIFRLAGIYGPGRNSARRDARRHGAGASSSRARSSQPGASRRHRRNADGFDGAAAAGGGLQCLR